jgi:adenosylhomocysteine nucleosidase
VGGNAKLSMFMWVAMSRLLPLGFVVGLTAEARIAARLGYPVLAGGGTPAGAAETAERLVRDGVRALVSFGLAGGLDPALRPGAMVVPDVVLADGQIFRVDTDLAARFGGLTGHRLLAGETIVADALTKRDLFVATGAQAVDLESGSVARLAASHGLPFAVVRAICDPAERDLPPAALIALDRHGAIGLMAVLGSVFRHPGQIPALLALAGDTSRARRSLTLVKCV